MRLTLPVLTVEYTFRWVSDTKKLIYNVHNVCLNKHNTKRQNNTTNTGICYVKFNETV